MQILKVSWCEAVSEQNPSGCIIGHMHAKTREIETVTRKATLGEVIYYPRRDMVKISVEFQFLDSEDIMHIKSCLIRRGFKTSVISFVAP